MYPSIKETAVRWAVRIDADTLGAAERRDLDDWLARDPRHRGALFRAQAGLALIDDAGTIADGPAVVRPPSRFRPSRRVAIAAAAACLVGAVALPWLLFRPEHYRTTIGEIRRVALADGSVTIVNTDSHIAVDYRSDERRIHLDRGEAWFKVAKNPRRPFVVDVDGVHVRATGTAFSVRRKRDAILIVVTEGKVVAWRDMDPDRRIPISVGNEAEIAISSPVAAPHVAPVANDDPLAWRQGGLALNEMTVFAAVEEFNRYNRRQLRVANPAVGRHAVTGYFQIDRPEQFAEAVSAITGARISNNSNEIVIE
jgi:transmembrane sensor